MGQAEGEKKTLKELILNPRLSDKNRRGNVCAPPGGLEAICAGKY